MLRRVVHRLADAIAFARDLGRDHHHVDWGDAAGLWASRYPALSEGRPGLFGAVTSRAEAQVVRLALLFALADQVPVIKTPHLQAALAIWDYCHDSAHFTFGRSFGNPVADQLLGHLRTAGPAGLSITEAYDRFGRHVSKLDLDRAFGLLEEQGLVSRQSRPDGRPARHWVLSPVRLQRSEVSEQSGPSFAECRFLRTPGSGTRDHAGAGPAHSRLESPRSLSTGCSSACWASLYELAGIVIETAKARRREARH